MVVKKPAECTDEKELIDQLIARDQIMELATKAGKIGLFEWKPQTNEADISDSWRYLIGVSDDYDGNPFEYFVSNIYEEDLDMAMSQGQVISSGKLDTYEMDFRFIHETLGLIWLRAVGKVTEYDAEGKATHVIGYHQDITEQKIAEQVMQRANQMLEYAEEIGGVGSWEWDVVSSKVVYSDNALKLYGIKPEDYDGELDYVFKVFHPDDRDFVLKGLEEMLAEKIPRLFEYRIILPDGEIRTISASSKMFFDESGAVTKLVGHIQDITERRKAELALQESEGKYRSLVETTNDWIWELDENGLYTYVSPMVKDLLGYDPEELIGKDPTDIMPPEEAKRIEGAIGQLFSLKEPFGGIENTNLHRDGHEVVLETKGVPIFDIDGVFRGFRGIDRDITERKKAEEAIKENEAKFRSLVESTQTVPFSFDLKAGLYTYMGAQVEKWLGYPHESWTDLDSWANRIHPEDREEIVNACAIDTAAGRDHVLEFRMITADGRTVWSREVISVASGIEGPERLNGFMFDITESKKVEQELSLLNQLVHNSLDAADIGPWWVDFTEEDTYHALDKTAKLIGRDPNPSGDTYSLYNDFAAILLEAKELGGVFAEAVDDTFEKWEGAISGKYGSYKSMWPAIQSDGTIRWFDARADVSKRDEEGKALSMVGTIIDVTERKKAEEELKIAKQAAEAANRAKSLFLANMSHEIRTPMNAILGYSQILQHDPSQSPKNLKSLKAINRSGKHLLELINDVLEISKIEAGRVTLDTISFDLHHLLENIESMFKIRTDKKDIALKLVIDEALPYAIKADERKLSQILINLVGNSVKFTDEGSITIQASLSSPGSLVVKVEDTGIGISEEEQRDVFKVFEKVGERTEGGTGLGLAISYEYAELMGGDIIVESEFGKGSVFRLEIPFAEGVKDEIKDKGIADRYVQSITPGQQEYRILVVDDNESNRELLSEVLVRVGFKVRMVVNGQEAIEAFKEWNPHVILMDMLMPVMDGAEATKRIREMEGGKEVSVIAVTASVLEEDKAEILAQGADDFVGKPIQEQEIFNSIKKVTGVEYLYEEPVAEKKAEIPLDRETVSVIPPKLRRRFYDAALTGQHNLLKEAAEDVSEIDEDIYRSLQILIDDYGYEQLISLFKLEEE